MITTQRLIMIVVFINVIIGMVGGIYQNPTAYSNEAIAENTDTYTQYIQNFQEDDKYASVKNTDYQQETTIGNAISMGKILWDIIWTGVNPISINRTDVDTQIEKIMVDMLVFFRVLMYILLAIEIYVVYKNNKGT